MLPPTEEKFKGVFLLMLENLQLVIFPQLFDPLVSQHSVINQVARLTVFLFAFLLVEDGF